VLEKDLTIVNRRGLHARASAKLVKLVETFDADVEVSRDGQTVGGTSIMGLMMLAASTGSCIKVRITGAQAEPALEAITDLVESGFGEVD
jgi:phosphocarrier protein